MLISFVILIIVKDRAKLINEPAFWEGGSVHPLTPS
jgi:hypothetical protein